MGVSSITVGPLCAFALLSSIALTGPLLAQAERTAARDIGATNQANGVIVLAAY